MRAVVRASLVAAVLVGAGSSVFMVRSSGAQGSYTPAPTSMTVNGAVAVNDLPPVDIGSSVRLDTNITNTYVPVAGDSLGADINVRIPTGVAITGTPNVSVTNIPTVALQNGMQVGLSSTTLNLLAGQRVCINYPIGNNLIDGGIFSVPTVAGQTGVSITTHAFGAAVDYVACWPTGADGGPLPSCSTGSTVANIPMYNQGNLTLDGITDSTVVKCTACTHSGPPSGGTALLGGNVSICTPLP